LGVGILTVCNIGKKSKSPFLLPIFCTHVWQDRRKKTVPTTDTYVSYASDAYAYASYASYVHTVGKTGVKDCDNDRRIRQSAKAFADETGFDPCLAIAVDTKGPEIRTGYLESTKHDFCVVHTAGLPDFSWSKHTKTEKVHQMTTNYTYQTALNYTKWQ
jgi:hypothetical protein